MNRYFHALSAAVGPRVPALPWVATSLAEAVDEVTLEGGDPTNDPAVLLLGAFVAFHTHADVNTTGGYHKLIDLCFAQVYGRTLQ
jgi:hypothetical protein